MEVSICFGLAQNWYLKFTLNGDALIFYAKICN